MTATQARIDAIERIRREHIPDPDGDPAAPHCVTCSDASYPIWPCAAAILLDRLAAVTAERDAEVARLTRETECADTIIKANAEAIAELEAERDAALAREALLREALELELQDEINAVLRGGSALTAAKGQEYLDQSPYVRRLRAALAAGQGDGQG